MKTALIAICAAVALVAGCQGDRTTRAQAAAPAAAGTSTSTAARNAPATGTASAASASARAPAPVLIPQTVASVGPPANQDVSAGRNIAAQGAPGAAACIGCHGANGEGNAQAGFPRLAALGRVYIEHQLNSYADGSRKNPVMTPIATALTAQQRAAVATYYASLSTPAASMSSKAGASVPTLVVRGDEKRGLQACANCHGPQGIGDAAANPYLAGQHATYLSNAIGAWKDGSRNNDPSRQMPAIAKALNDAEAKQLATYFASLPAPAPRNSQAAAMAVNTSRPAIQSGPVAATAPNVGTGTQQGAPLTGGAQGPAAGGAATNPAQTPK